jgi:hypothetical protein
MALSWLRPLSVAESTDQKVLSSEPIDYYLGAYNTLEAATKRAQALIDTLHKAAIVLTQFGATGYRRP